VSGDCAASCGGVEVTDSQMVLQRIRTLLLTLQLYKSKLVAYVIEA